MFMANIAGSSVIVRVVTRCSAEVASSFPFKAFRARRNHLARRPRWWRTARPTAQRALSGISRPGGPHIQTGWRRVRPVWKAESPVAWPDFLL